MHGESHHDLVQFPALAVKGTDFLVLVRKHGCQFVQITVQVTPEADRLFPDVHPVGRLVRNHVDFLFEFVHHEGVRAILVVPSEQQGCTHIHGDIVTSDRRTAPPWDVVLLEDKDPQPPLGQQPRSGQPAKTRTNDHNVVTIPDYSIVE